MMTTETVEKQRLEATSQLTAASTMHTTAHSKKNPTSPCEPKKSDFQEHSIRSKYDWSVNTKLIAVPSLETRSHAKNHQSPNCLLGSNQEVLEFSNYLM